MSRDPVRDVDAGSNHSAIGRVRFDSPVKSSSYFSEINKRKWSVLDCSINLKDGSSLVLGLGCSSSSCATILSENEIEMATSANHGLNTNLHLGYSGANESKCFSCSGALQVSRPKLDLELSLSTGPAESDVTTITNGSSLYQCASSPPALQAVQLVDEGSTSSRWKCGALLPPMRDTDNFFAIGQVNGFTNLNQVIPNISPKPAARPKDSVPSTSGVDAPQQQRGSCMKTCSFGGCTKGARGASGLCIAHGGGRRCQRVGCQKGAEGRTVFCKAHGGGRRCQFLGCTKSAEGRTDYCISHGGGKRCSHEGCSRAARGKSGLCIRHGGGKRCKMENCTKSAEGISGLCISHGGGRRCKHPGCTKGSQGSTNFCKAHGGGKRCTFIGCTKGAEGSTPFCKGHGGGKRCTFLGCTKSVHGGTQFCVSHGGGKRCATPGCTKSARGRTSFCVRHGGGKRCKIEGCTKSAQGSTDFCKAHGGGKRCSWGQFGSDYGSLANVQCDKFARGKSGLCAAHSAEVVDNDVVISTMVPATHGVQSSSCGKTRGIFSAGNIEIDDFVTAEVGGSSLGSSGYVQQSSSVQILPEFNSLVENVHFGRFSLPEGRVHGGGLMALLRGTASRNSNSDQVEHHAVDVPKRWV